jgi:hypothetical protein
MMRASLSTATTTSEKSASPGSGVDSCWNARVRPRVRQVSKNLTPILVRGLTAGVEELLRRNVCVAEEALENISESVRSCDRSLVGNRSRPPRESSLSPRDARQRTTTVMRGTL